MSATHERPPGSPISPPVAELVDGARFPFSPKTLVLTLDPCAEELNGEITERLADLLARRRLSEAHRLAAGLHLHLRPAAAWFYLLEISGRRGARRLLRWLREDADRSDAERLFVPWAAPPLAAWGQLRLHRYGRGQELARGHLDRLLSAEQQAEPPEEALIWAQALQAMRRTALRRGKLRIALNIFELQEALQERWPGVCPQATSVANHMGAVSFLLERHAEHRLPASLARYLARSLGHDGGHSDAGFADLVRDLSLRPDHLERALALSSSFGFAQGVDAHLALVQEQLFRGNWRARRGLQRAAMLLFWAAAAASTLLGFTLLVHALRG